MAGNSSEPGRTVVGKTATILLALTLGGGHTLSSLSCQTRLPVSTVHRHIRDLAKTPLVERNADGEYRLGPALHNLTHCAGTSFPNSARLPLHATASGKALLAFMPISFLRVVAAAGFPRYTPHTVASIDELRHLLVQVRRHGFATSHLELHPSACAVAVPLFNHNGYPVCAMEVQVPDLTESTLAQVTPALVITARRLSRELSPQQEHATPAAVGGP
jgi:IclR family transcriptional regulator, acetate operon repressor